MITLAKLKKLNTIEDLEGSGLIGELDIEISHRGGHLGYLGQDVAQSLGINWGLLPRKVGAYVNYLDSGCEVLSGVLRSNNYQAGTLHPGI
jgi:hypothetical protein